MIRTQQVPIVYGAKLPESVRGWKCNRKTQDAFNLCAVMNSRHDLPIEVFLPAIYDIEDSGTIFKENMPNLRFIRTCYMLPNLLNELTHCCFSNVNINAATRTSNPMIHVLSKAWPVRCSIRNFSDIVSNYISKEAHVRDCLTEMLYCTFSGSYPHCSKHDDCVHFKCQHILYRYFVHMKPNADVLSNWIRSNHQHIVFVCIKEYIVFLVNNVPGLSHVLHQIHPWADFVFSVTEQANFMRQKMRRNIINNQPIFENIQSGITSMRSFRCKLNSGNTKPKISIDTKDMAFHPKYLHVYNAPLRIQFYKILKSTGISDYDVAFKTFGLSNLAKFNEFDHIFACRELSCAVNFVCNESFVTLPKHIVDQQKKSLVKCRRQTSVFVCICCRQIRSFVVNSNTASKNAWARGNSKVLIDDCTNELYCGKKIEKSNSVSSSLATESVSKKNRMYWKTENNLMCKYSRLINVELVGRIYNLFGTSYVLCPSCLCVMEYKTDRVRSDTIMCIHCQYTSNVSCATKACFHCYNVCSKGQNLSISIQSKKYSVCKSCYKPWMEISTVTNSINIDLAHRAINERWKVNRINAEIQASR